MKFLIASDIHGSAYWYRKLLDRYEEEKADSEVASTAVGDYFRKSRTDFALGNLDPYSDADWNEYVSTVWDLGLQDWLDVAQVAYDRG